ncbi:MAG: EamA family transporter [Herminiimonas sp.]|nr:EamA family transporter [Herminiimonas sp.]
MNNSVTHALLAAALFGASTPFSKMLLGQIAPIMLAGLLYIGSGIGLLAWFCVRRFASRRSAADVALLTAKDTPWLAGAIFFGGIAAPVLLMTGLAMVSASSASLLLNLEGVLTSFLAWFVFKENFDRRIFLGMTLIVAGGAVLAWQPGSAPGVPWGALAIVAACACWAIDNNLTRKVSASDAVQIAAIKGVVAGVVNLSIAMALGFSLPPVPATLLAAVIGFLGYGLSLVLFVLALRGLGTARTGAYFSVAPFVGAALSLALLGEAPDIGFWVAGVLMAAGIWLHLTESHGHAHSHDETQHLHEHSHDTHHQHEHDFAWDSRQPHTHSHHHEPMHHAHPHFPDTHHRHKH